MFINKFHKNVSICIEFMNGIIHTDMVIHHFPEQTKYIPSWEIIESSPDTFS
jgi:hypothetical protein